MSGELFKLIESKKNKSLESQRNDDWLDSFIKAHVEGENPFARDYMEKSLERELTLAGEIRDKKQTKTVLLSALGYPFQEEKDGDSVIQALLAQLETMWEEQRGAGGQQNG